jgi:glycine cleavage system H protein
MDAGVVNYRLCDHEFECETCLFDQAIRGETPALAVQDRAAGLKRTKGPRGLPDFLISSQCFYSPNHMWARVEGSARVRVGLDDFGQQLMGQVYAVRIPPPGAITRDDTIEVINQLGSHRMRSPVEGLVVWVNSELQERPSLVNKAPFTAGSLFMIEPDDLAGQLKEMRYGLEAEEWLETEADELGSEVFELMWSGRPGIGVTAPDGGELVADWLDTARRQDTFRPVLERFLISR